MQLRLPLSRERASARSLFLSSLSLPLSLSLSESALREIAIARYHDLTLISTYG